MLANPRPAGEKAAPPDHGAYSYRALADLLCRLAGSPSPLLQELVVRLGAAQADGHACLPQNPTAAQCAELRARLVVGAPGSGRPLVPDVADRLFFERDHRREQGLAIGLLALLAPHGKTAPLPEEQRAAAITRFFGDNPSGLFHKLANGALQSRLCVVTGGPGTGKTTTVAKLLGLLLSLHPRHEQPLRIRLAALTGKAAARMQESLRNGASRVADLLALPQQVPEEPSTLHRLLGISGEGRPPRYHAGNPLAAGILLVDEVSMISLPLFAQLLDALLPHTRLFLLGDNDQLPSVEGGAVLADIQAAARHNRALGERCMHLNVSHRFPSDSPIGRISAAVNSEAGDAEPGGAGTHLVARLLPEEGAACGAQLQERGARGPRRITTGAPCW